MIFTDSEGNKFEAELIYPVNPNTSQTLSAFYLKPIGEATVKDKPERYSWHLEFGNIIEQYFELTKPTARALGEALEAVIEFIEKPKGLNKSYKYRLEGVIGKLQEARELYQAEKEQE